MTSPAGEVTRWSRDAAGHADMIEYPHGGVEVRAFDSRGWLSMQTLPHGTTLAYTRDAAGRVVERRGDDASFVSDFYGAGYRSTSHADSTGTTVYAYDPAGRHVGLEQPTGAHLRYGRDALDRVTSVAVREPGAAAARETTYVYDAAGHLTEVHDPLGGVTTMVYDADGRLSMRTLPNGVQSTWTYDARSRVESIVHMTSTGATIASADYVRSPSGEPTRITREDGTYVRLRPRAAPRARDLPRRRRRRPRRDPLRPRPRRQPHAPGDARGHRGLRLRLGLAPAAGLARRRADRRVRLRRRRPGHAASPAAVAPATSAGTPTTTSPRSRAVWTRRASTSTPRAVACAPSTALRAPPPASTATLKLADFGIAAVLTLTARDPSGMTLRNFFTRPFAAPEQLLQKQPGFPSDVYGFALLTAALLALSEPDTDFDPAQLPASAATPRDLSAHSRARPAWSRAGDGTRNTRRRPEVVAT